MHLFIQTHSENSDQQQIHPSGKDFVCKICKSLVSETRYLFSIQSTTPYHIFTNPSGYQFYIMTFSHCFDLLDISLPTIKDSWFSEYTWSISCCSTCHSHLGWHYMNSSLALSDFYGIIRQKVEFQEG